MKSIKDSSGNAFSFDGEFHFHEVGAIPEGCIESDKGNEIEASIVGCYYLSGASRPMWIFWSDGMWTERFLVTRVMGRFVVSRDASLEVGMGICGEVGICGPVCSMPGKVAKLCREVSGVGVYACPLVDGLAAFGFLVAGMMELKNERLSMLSPNTEELEGSCQHYEDDLEADGLGRMADLVAKGMTVCNDMMTTPMREAFYGRVLSFRSYGEPVYLLRSGEARKVFEGEIVQVRDYAAMTVPVETDNTEQFSRMTGCLSKKVRFMVSSSYRRGMSDFLRFLKAMSGRGWVASSSPKSFVPEMGVPVFRHHGGYRIDRNDYMGVFNAG